MSAAPPRTAPLVLDMLDDTRVSFRFALNPATQLGDEINALIGSFKKLAAASQTGERVVADPLQYRFQDDSLSVSMECNPNIFPNAFNARVYIVVDDGNVRVSSQTLLTRLIDNVKAYKASMSV